MAGNYANEKVRTRIQITVFDSTGLTIQDVATADMVYQKVLKANIEGNFNSESAFILRNYFS